MDRKKTGSAVLLKGGHLKEKQMTFCGKTAADAGLWERDFLIQYPRHRLYPFLRSGLPSGGGQKSEGKRRAGQGICGRGYWRGPGSGRGKRALSITCTLWTDADPVDLHFAVQADYQTFPGLQSAGFQEVCAVRATCTVISGVLTSKRRSWHRWRP